MSFTMGAVENVDISQTSVIADDVSAENKDDDDEEIEALKEEQRDEIMEQELETVSKAFGASVTDREFQMRLALQQAKSLADRKMQLKKEKMLIMEGLGNNQILSTAEIISAHSSAMKKNDNHDSSNRKEQQLCQVHHH